MPFPKLTPLQSRLAASVTASILLLLLYLALFSPNFAYASDVGSIRPEDHNHERLLEIYSLGDTLEDTDDLEIREVEYESEFLGADRGIIGRAPADVTALTNNVPTLINVLQGETKHFVFENVSLSLPRSNISTGLPSPVRLRRTADGDDDGIDEEEAVEPETLRKRQVASTKLYITLTTCMQPYNPSDQAGTGGPPPQVELYVSTTQRNTMPGPGSFGEQQQITVLGGYANITLQASDSVWIGVFAPNSSSKGFVDPYSIEIAGSIDDQYHQYNSSEPNLYLIDSDTTSALLVTNNLTTTTNGTLFDKWMGLSPPPFVIFASNTNYSAIEGVRNSYCGLEKYAIIAGTKGGVRTDTVQTSMTNETLGPFAKQQFYFQGLNGSSTYYGILGITGNSTKSGAGVVGGGGRIYKSMNFPTQSGMLRELFFDRNFVNIC
jgi:calcium channel MID1